VFVRYPAALGLCLAGALAAGLLAQQAILSGTVMAPARVPADEAARTDEAAVSQQARIHSGARGC
jgi:hypothetical protein